MSGKQVQIRVPQLQTRNCLEAGGFWYVPTAVNTSNLKKNLQVELLSSAGIKRGLDLFGSKICSTHITVAHQC